MKRRRFVRRNETRVIVAGNIRHGALSDLLSGRCESIRAGSFTRGKMLAVDDG